MPQSTATLEIEPNQVNPATDPQPGDAAAAAVSSTAASEPPAGCPQCGNLESWGRSSWCPECGYYPRLGTSIGRASGEGSQAAACAAPKSPREVWEQMPVWMKILCGGILAIVAESILVRAATADASLVRSVWGVLQLVMGFGVFAMFHAIAAMKASMSNNRIGLIDALMHPGEAWRPTIDELPKTARRVWLAAWGLTAALCALGIVGGIRFSALVDDWGFRKRVDPTLTARMRSSANQKTEGGVTLAAQTARRGDIEVLALDCVVVGYTMNTRDGVISNLLLASLIDGELRYVGTVAKGIPEGIGNELAERLSQLKRNVPVVKCRASGIWVKPIVACKANFTSWTDDKLMIDPEFQELMAEVDYVE